MMKLYYRRLKTKTLKENQITFKNRKTNNIFTLFIIKRFPQIDIFNLSDDILRSTRFIKLLQSFV